MSRGAYLHVFSEAYTDNLKNAPLGLTLARIGMGQLFIEINQPTLHLR
jgi:hypothetical protein